MKAQRRRKLKANSLIWTLQGLPETIKKYQSQVSLGLVLIALAVVLYQYRSRTAQERLQAAQTSLGNAADDLQRLRTMGFDPEGDVQTFMRLREGYYSDGLQQVDTVLQKAPGLGSANESAGAARQG